MLPTCDRCHQPLDPVGWPAQEAATAQEEGREWYARFCPACDVVLGPACAPTEWDDELKTLRSHPCPMCGTEMEMLPTTAWLQRVGRASPPYSG